MKAKIYEYFDYVVLLSILVLITFGVLFIYSSGISSDGVNVSNEYIKQIIWACVGLVFLTVFTLYDYRKIERLAPWLYITLIVLLVITRLFGREVNGAVSWIGFGGLGVQPSEFGKVFFILYFAKFLDDSKNDEELGRFIKALALLMIPVGLILIQPDMGTGSVYIPVFLVMCFMAGIPLRFILFVLFFGLTTIFIAILPVWNSQIADNPLTIISILTTTKLRIILIGTTSIISLISVYVRRYLKGPKYFYWIAYFSIILTLGLVFSLGLSKFLKDYQIKRLIIFMNPQVDPLGAGWNIIQSKTAIGAGGLWGRGFLGGTQSHYRFLPQQSTDFIFSILSEESGFVGGLVIYGLYLTILLRMAHSMRKIPNKYGLYIVSGVFAMFSFHFIINVGMVMGMMPITGIPLLFLSYGGSSLLTAMSCSGLYMSINFRKKDLQ